LELALYATGAQLERLCRGYRTALAVDETPSLEDRCVRQRVLPSGMVKLEIVLCPDEADLVMRALDRAREVEHPCDTQAADVSAETSLPSRADGVVALAESYLAGNPVHGNGGERFQVMVHLDQDALGADGSLAGTLDDGTHVSAETLRRVACDCGVVAVRGEGESLNIGRRTRTIPPAIRRALALRDHGCCFPGCTHTRFLHGHHIQHWLHGGETSVDNLVLLCTAHHHMVHEDGWSVARTAEGELRFTSPTGKALPVEPPSAPVENTLVWLQEWAVDRGLDLGPDANQPLWDGTRLDYDYAVSALLAAG
jgi:hypothetical protein